MKTDEIVKCVETALNIKPDPNDSFSLAGHLADDVNATLHVLEDLIQAAIDSYSPDDFEDVELEPDIKRYRQILKEIRS